MNTAGKIGSHRPYPYPGHLQTHPQGLLAGVNQCDPFDLNQGLLYVRRTKNGSPSAHTIRGPVIRALRRLNRDYPDTPHVFIIERKSPLTTSTVRTIITRLVGKAGIGVPVHPRMLRHASGFFLANEGHDTHTIKRHLGHMISSIRCSTLHWLRINSTVPVKTDHANSNAASALSCMSDFGKFGHS